MKMVSECLKVIVDAMLENCGLADAPVNIKIDNTIYDVVDFYYDNEISEYVMVLNHDE